MGYVQFTVVSLFFNFHGHYLNHKGGHSVYYLCIPPIITTDYSGRSKTFATQSKHFWKVGKIHNMINMNKKKTLQVLDNYCKKMYSPEMYSKENSYKVFMAKGNT